MESHTNALRIKTKLKLMLIFPLAVSLSFITQLAGAAGAQLRVPTVQIPVLEAQTGPTIKPPAKAQILRKMDANLLSLQQEFKTYVARGGRPALGVFKSANPEFHIRGNQYVVVDVVATTDTAFTVATLERLGCRNLNTFQRTTSAECPMDNLEKLGSEADIHFVRPAMAHHHSGAVTSQGDQALGADIARSTYGITGNGITVGVLSDSYDCNTSALTHAANDVASGDLPAGVMVLADITSGCTDEGRAMLQIIHDVAPGAALAFNTADTGEAAFATGILALRNTAHAHVIVDDVVYFSEPMFQDGIIAQAVDQVVNDGAAYFSSAGNEARKSYQATFTPSSQFDVYGGKLHDFDPGINTDVFQKISLPTGTTTYISFQWDEPFFSVSGAPGASSDYDIWICLSDTQPVNTINCPIRGISDNLGGDAIEILAPTVGGNAGGTLTVYLAISRFSGASNNLMKYIAFSNSVAINEYDTASGTLYGHANATGAEAVGAAAYYATPAFGVSPPALEAFSSAGGVPIRLNTSGASITPVIRNKPGIVAPDGGNTTFFYSDSGADTDTYPNFFGTSAAAPHAAAVAALMLQAGGGTGSITPVALYSAMRASAIDMKSAGFDFDSGYGLLNAQTALANVAKADLSVTQTASPNPVFIGAQTTYTLTIQNSGTATALGTSLTDTLPASANFVSASSGCSHANGIVTCALGNLPGGATVAKQIVVQANVAGGLANTAQATSTTAEANPANNTSSLNSVLVNPLADLAVTQIATPTTGWLNNSLTYTITVNNSGPSTAQGVYLTDVLPLWAGFVSASGNCSFANGSLSCLLGDLAVGASTSINLILQINTLADGGNSVQAGSATTDPTPQNNTSTLQTSVYPWVDLLVSQTATPDPVSLNGLLTYTITVTNLGQSAGEGVILTDTLPPSSSFFSADYGCNESSGVVTCALGEIQSGATVSRQITVQAAALGALENQAQAATLSPDYDPTNNLSVKGVSVLPPTPKADLTLNLTNPANPVVAGEAANFSYSVTNAGPSDAQAVILTVNLPASANLATSSPECTQQATTVTCALGSVASGRAKTGFLAVRFSVPGNLPISGSLTSDTQDPVSANNSASLSTTVNPTSGSTASVPALPEWALVLMGAILLLMLPGFGRESQT